MLDPSVAANAPALIVWRNFRRSTVMAEPPEEKFSTAEQVARVFAAPRIRLRTVRLLSRNPRATVSRRQRLEVRTIFWIPFRSGFDRCSGRFVYPWAHARRMAAAGFSNLSQKLIRKLPYDD